MAPRNRQPLLPPPAPEEEWSALMTELAPPEAAPEPTDAELETALRGELGLDEPPPAPAVDTADPYTSVRSKGYGPETAGQMAAPEAPIYTPKAPPEVGDAMTAMSDSKGRLAGVDPRFREIDANVARLGELRSKMPAQAAPTGPGRNEQAFRTDMSAQDEKARKAFLMNWLAGGPQQAMQFQQAYEQKRSNYLKGLQEARSQDTQLAQGAKPISDAQAQVLVRVYGMTPEAVANMTAAEYAQLEGVLRSAPYAINQQEAQRNKQSQKELDFIGGQLKDERGNATDFGIEQLQGQQALNTVRANKKAPGGGGVGSGPRDIVPVLAGTHKIDEQQANLAYQRVLEGLPAENAEQEAVMTTAKMLIAANNKDFAAHRAKVLSQGVLGRTNRVAGIEAGLDAKSRDPSKTLKEGDAYQDVAIPFESAYRAALRLKAKSGNKIATLVNYGRDIPGSVMTEMNLTPEDRADAAAIRQFVVSYAFSKGGKALTESEISQLGQYTGIVLGDQTSASSLLQDPKVLLRFLDGMRKVLSDRKKRLLQAYPGALGGGK